MTGVGIGVFLVILPSVECHWTLLKISQHWFRWWLGALRRQTITGVNIHSDLCRHMASVGHNDLRRFAVRYLHHKWTSSILRKFVLNTQHHNMSGCTNQVVCTHSYSFKTSDLQITHWCRRTNTLSLVKYPKFWWIGPACILNGNWSQPSWQQFINFGHFEDAKTQPVRRIHN